MAAPRDAVFRVENGDIGCSTPRYMDEAGGWGRMFALRHQPALEIHRIGHGGREPDRLHAGCKAAQAPEGERQEMAALGGDQRMQLIKDDVFQVLEEPLRLLVGEQQRHLFGRGQQDIGRVELLALSFRLRRVAGAVLDGDGKPHFGDRLHQVALDIDRQRLERRDVERVDTGKGRAGWDLATHDQIGQRRHEARKRLAGTGRGDQQHVFAGLGAGEKFQLVGARRPALFREPFEERAGQSDSIRAGRWVFDEIHVVKVRRTARK